MPVRVLSTTSTGRPISPSEIPRTSSLFEPSVVAGPAVDCSIHLTFAPLFSPSATIVEPILVHPHTSTPSIQPYDAAVIQIHLPCRPLLSPYLSTLVCLLLRSLSLLIAFLQSPLWLVPLDRFIDSNSLSFTPNTEHSFSHTSIHLAYTQLAESLLTTHLPTLSIDPSSLPSLLSTALSPPCPPTQPLLPSTRRSLEHLLTLDDYLVFHTRMVQRNIDLDREVLEGAMREERGRKNKVKERERQGGRGGPREGEGEEEQLRLAMELSMMEEEGRKKEREKEEAELAYAIALSLALQAQEGQLSTALPPPTQPSAPPAEAPPTAESAPAKEVHEEEKEAAPAEVSPAVSRRSSAEFSADGQLGTGRSAMTASLGPLKGIRKPVVSSRVVESVSSARSSSAAASSTPPSLPSSVSASSSVLTPAEVQAKVKFLRAQRDILIAQKQKHAEEELQAFEREVEQGEDDCATPKGKEASPEEVKRAAMRRLLQQRLRMEAGENDRAPSGTAQKRS